MEIKSPSAISPVASTPTVSSTPSLTGTNVNLPSSAMTDTLQLSGLLALLKTGQQLEVIVAALEGKQLLLQLPTPLIDEQGNRSWIQFRAPANIPVQVGQKLHVEVVDANPTLPVLKLAASSNLPLTLQTALNSALARQQPSPDFYANLAWLNQPQASQYLDKLPAAVRDAIETLWRQLPAPEQAQRAEQIKQLLQHSGVFLEANLAMNIPAERGNPAMDLRASLLRLATALRENPLPSSFTPAKPETAHTEKTTALPPHPQLPQPQPRQEATVVTLKSLELLFQQIQQQTDSTVARMQTQQLQMIHPESTRPGWLLELPIRHEQGVDVFDMRIFRDGKSSPEETAQHNWNVMLAFDLEGIGAIRAQIHLQDNTVSTYWWAEQSNTVRLFQEYLEILRNRLASAGLSIGQLRCQQGNATASTISKPTGYTNTTIDERI